MHLWASVLLYQFGVLEQHIADIALDVFARAAAEWPLFQPPAELPARTARRRWLTERLLCRTAEYRRAGRQVRPPPEPPAAAPAVAAPAPASDLLPWLSRATTPARWRAWLAREVDDVPIAEIARQEGCSPERIFRRLDAAYRDLQTAFARSAGGAG